jgi:hypothetical protein
MMGSSVACPRSEPGARFSRFIWLGQLGAGRSGTSSQFRCTRLASVPNRFWLEWQCRLVRTGAGQAPASPRVAATAAQAPIVAWLEARPMSGARSIVERHRGELQRPYQHDLEGYMSQSAVLAASDDAPPIDLRNLVWVALALAVLAVAIAIDDLWLLNFIHVMAGVLWTGIDLFTGFVIGRILRRAPFAARRAIVLRLMPKTLFLLPTLATITGTAGWYHARQLGLLDIPYPAFWWVFAALVIVAILTVQGFAVLLPANLLVYFEMRKPAPDGARIGRLMRRYVYAVASQGVMQVAIIVVMARFVTGL